MIKSDKSLGQLELEILKIIWQQPPCTVQEVAEVMAQRRGYARTTVLTVIQRLHAKKFLKRRKQKGLYRYYPTTGRRRVISGLVGHFIDTVLDGSAQPFVAYLSDSQKLTADEIETLREIACKLDRESREVK